MSLHFWKRIPFASARSAGFTLPELLVTISIIAVLTGVTLVAINPVEYIRRGRDSQRTADLSSFNTLITQYRYSGNRVSMGDPNTVYVSLPDSTSTCANLSLPDLPSGWSYHCATSADYRKTDGTGWLPVNLSETRSFSAMPVDPTNDANYYYAYVTDGSSGFAMTAMYESKKQLSDVASRDAGNDEMRFEVGTKIPLWDAARGLLAYWKFDEGSGSVANDSVATTTLAVRNLVNWIDGKKGKAMQMDSTVSTGCVNQDAGAYTSNVPTSIRLIPSDAFTLSWWTKLPANSGTSRIHLAATSVTSCGTCSIWNQRTYAEIRTTAQDNNDLSYNYTFPLNTWYHMTFVFDKPNLTTRIYVDGKKINERPLTAGGDFGQIQWIAMGVYTPGCVDSIPGEAIDDVRLYGSVLSDKEIESMYRAAQ